MTERFKNLGKKGWHPERDAGSGTGGVHDSKIGQVKGWAGRGQSNEVRAAEAARQHQSAPLSSLRDPASFAPPPKRVGDTRGSVASTSTVSATDVSPKPAPSLPPRLPPRQNSNPDAYAPPPPPTYNEATQHEATTQGALNQGALNRLGQAGVSVPGFGIGKAPPPVPPRQNSTSSTPTCPPASASQKLQLSELQSRFSRTSTSPSGGASPATGTTWAEKQAALRTGEGLRDDPSKVSASDLKGAATTANNFQQRHGNQVASGLRAAGGLNQKYGIAGKMNSLASSSTAPATQQESVPSAVKPPPPPPPPKRRALGESADKPPPIPLGSKPKF